MGPNNRAEELAFSFESQLFASCSMVLGCRVVTWPEIFCQESKAARFYTPEVRSCLSLNFLPDIDQHIIILHVIDMDHVSKRKCILLMNMQKANLTVSHQYCAVYNP